MSASAFTVTPTEKNSNFLKRKAVDTELQPIDRQLKRLKDEILPSSPYLLTVPTKVPYHLGNRIVNNWAVGDQGPFTPEEQNLQYLTFLTHQDDDSLLVAVGDWSEINDSAMAEDDHKSSNPTGAGSPSLNAPTKKKISLSDYKSKAKSATLPSAGTSLERDNRVDPKEKSLNADHQSSSKASNHAGASQNLRHPNSPVVRAGPEQDRLTTNAEKKNALKAEQTKNAPNARQYDAALTSRTKDISNKRDSPSVLPALLSPTLPPTSRSPKLLPELLSPTLPPELEEELANWGEVSPIGGSFRGANIPLKSAAPIASSNAGVAKRPRSTSLLSTSSDQTSLPREGRNEPTNARTSVNRKETLVSSGNSSASKSHSSNPQNSQLTTNASKTPKLVVKLRYGRLNRKRVDALLRLSKPRASTEPADSTKSKAPALESSERDDGHLSSNDSERHSHTRIPEKRPRHSDEDIDGSHSHANKRPRTISSSDNPRTPTTVTSKPAGAQPQQTPTGKTPQATPGRDIQRNSQQSIQGDGEVRTPQALATKTVPLSEDRNLKSSPPVNSDAPHVRTRDDERKAWRDEFQRLAKLGRELKHASDRRAKSGATDESITTADEKLATATAVEAVLCFILAFIADDRSKSVARQVGDSSNWRSILAYWRVVKMKAAQHPPLHGLCLLLGAVSHDAIHALDLERLAICVLPDEHSPVPTPGSDGNTVTSEESKKQRREFADLKSRLPEYYKEAHRLWVDGSRELSEDVLTKNFPETWSKRSRKFSEQGAERLRRGNYSGDYFLPLGRTTTPLEAVRFGMSILKEWCKKEGLEYESRLWR